MNILLTLTLLAAGFFRSIASGECISYYSDNGALMTICAVDNAPDCRGVVYEGMPRLWYDGIVTLERGAVLAEEWDLPRLYCAPTTPAQLNLSSTRKVLTVWTGLPVVRR